MEMSMSTLAGRTLSSICHAEIASSDATFARMDGRAVTFSLAKSETAPATTNSKTTRWFSGGADGGGGISGC